MIFVVGFVLVILILLLLLRLDYSLGRKNHINKATPREFPLRKSDLTFFKTGENLFSDLFTEIQQAKSHIHIQFYIMQNDDFSKEFVSLLMDKAKQGIEVRLLLDWVGSNNVTKKQETLLKSAGVSFSYSNKPSLPYFFYKLNSRNHRKVTVIDGKIGYIGGFNIGKEYLGKDEQFGLWRDYHIKMTGEGVADLQKQFLNDWFEATDQVVTSQEAYYPTLQTGKSEMKLIATDGVYLEESLVKLLNSAKEQITIGTPYFVPGDGLKQALIDAVNRNVSIRVLTPKKADHPLVKEAAIPFIDELSKLGIRFYAFTKGFYHAKAILIDEEICDIGTTNFDKRSLYSNFEINCLIYDKEFIKTVKKQVDEDFSSADEITTERLEELKEQYKFKIKLASLFQHFL